MKKKAANDFAKLAEEGDAWSQMMLGKCYLYGKGLEPDFDQAVYWFQCAAEQGETAAQELLGECYENGWGVEVDAEKAKEYYKLAEENGG